MTCNLCHRAVVIARAAPAPSGGLPGRWGPFETTFDSPRSQMEDHANLWIKRAFRTDPIEPEKITKAIEGLYKVAGLKRPRVVIAPSPVVMAAAYGAAAAIWHNRWYMDEATRIATIRATVDATRRAVRSATGKATDRAVRSATGIATVDATIRATADATGIATVDATRMRSALA